ncbi:MAG: HlyD family secretion protein [Nitrospirae bacterium]|nr:HlyD family secretion protein [Nitrospirota bacterium]
MEPKSEINGEPGREPGKKKIAIAALIILAIAAAATVYMYHSYAATHVSTDDAFMEGTIYTIAPKVPGTVSHVYVNDNQLIKKGDLLVTIDPSDYEAKLKEAGAKLDMEKAKLGEFESRLETAGKMLIESEGKAKSSLANLAARKADLDQANKDAKRAENLYASEAISREKYEKTLTSLKVLTAESALAERQLGVSEESINTQRAVVAMAKSMMVTQEKTIEKETAVFTQARLNYNYTRIYAPSDGYVNKKSVESGNQVQTGQPLMAVVPLDDVWVVANYKETELARIKPGQRVSIKVDAYPGKTFHGKVDSFMAGTGSVFSLFPPENATGHYVKIVQRLPVKILLDKESRSEHQFRIGMSVVPTVIVE